jgi:hypothetical protein
VSSREKASLNHVCYSQTAIENVSLSHSLTRSHSQLSIKRFVNISRFCEIEEKIQQILHLLVPSSFTSKEQAKNSNVRVCEHVWGQASEFLERRKFNQMKQK